ncbi:hypothetical protein DPMN_097641 [Dreissena polymorpha]|uniref:Uncharacterized protein n=1 Tax=Dreissena polymorpha TaxID=45954 RepID=A0A9D4LBH6_DREPO|nr:hypothetical protein DPMN_097641 [Dreissena polymorpha]
MHTNSSLRPLGRAALLTRRGVSLYSEAPQPDCSNHWVQHGYWQGDRKGPRWKGRPRDSRLSRYETRERSSRRH